MEAPAARVASLMLRRNSRKNLSSVFSQWSLRSPRDHMRRKAMGGAPLDAVAPPAEQACPDIYSTAFSTAQLAPTNSVGKESLFLLSQMSSLTTAASGLLLSPATSLKDPSGLLSPQVSVGKGVNLDALLLRATSSSLAAHRGGEDGVASLKPTA